MQRDLSPLTYREYSERYAGTVFDGTESSPLWEKAVPTTWAEFAVEGRRVQFVVIDGGRRDV